jgi:hypothetical protein
VVVAIGNVTVRPGNKQKHNKDTESNSTKDNGWEWGANRCGLSHSLDNKVQNVHFLS